MNEETRTLELTETDCAHLAHVCLHEREYMRANGAAATPTLDGLLRKLHALYPEQNWIRFLEE